MNQQRRTLTRAIIKGGGTISLGAIPAVWTKPVVESVLLPAHAQTTSCADVLTLGQLTIGCGDSVVDEIVSLFIDESGSCSVLAPYPSNGGVEGLLTGIFRIPGQIFELLVGLGKLTDTGTLDSSGGYEAQLISDDGCPDPDPVQNTIDEIPFELLGSAGGRYRVTAVASTDLTTGTVSIANILITRIG